MGERKEYNQNIVYVKIVKTFKVRKCVKAYLWS